MDGGFDTDDQDWNDFQLCVEIFRIVSMPRNRQNRQNRRDPERKAEKV